MSRVSNHINRNIDQDRSSTDADVEFLNINSSAYNTQDSENHEASLNEAWRFINAARHQNFTQNEGLQRNHIDNYQRFMDDHYQPVYENITRNYITRPNSNNTPWIKTANKKYNRNFSFSSINDYLDTLDDSSDEESTNVNEEKYFNIEHASQEAVEIYDGSIYAVGNEGRMLIYSYKNKYDASDTNEVLINSPNQESQSNSTGSVSVENLNEESVSYERSFYRISTSFHPVIIPRLPLTSYMLPTVTEILEPPRQSPKVTELSDEDNASIKRKPSNSWVMNEGESSHSDADNTTETNVENSADESPDNKKQSNSPINSISNHYESYSKTDLKVNTENSENRVLVDLHSRETFNPVSTVDSARMKYEKEILKQRNNYLDARDVIQIDSAFRDIERDSNKSKQSYTSPVELLSKHSSIPTLHLSLNTETDPHEQSWFKRFIKCILCCK